MIELCGVMCDLQTLGRSPVHHVMTDMKSLEESVPLHVFPDIIPLLW